MTEPIAVTGFSVKFPQEATSAESFWEMLSQRRNATTEVPRDRMNIDAFYHPDPARVGKVRVWSFRLSMLAAGE